MARRPDQVYRATDPASVAKSLTAYNAARTAFFDEVKQFGLELGHEVAVLGSADSLFANHLLPSTVKDGDFVKVSGAQWTRDGLFLNYREESKVADIPPGWHYYVKELEVRPYRGGRDRASKAAVQALNDLNAKSPNGLKTWLGAEFGTPTGPFDNMGFEPVGDTYFVLAAQHPFNPGLWEGNEHFEPVPMSTYWLAKEQATAPSEAP